MKPTPVKTAFDKPKEKLAERFRRLDSTRNSKMSRGRSCAGLTIPGLLPPQGWTEQMMLPQPYSSVGARGVTSLASRMLSAMLPINDTPFFKLALKSGTEPSSDISAYLEILTHQIFRKLIATNLRETLFQAIQSLIVVGDTLVHVENDSKFRTTRLDNYVCVRSVEGDLQELIYIQYEVNEDKPNELKKTKVEKQGYDKFYCQLKMDKKGQWNFIKEDEEGKTTDTGKYSVLPCVPLRWYSVTGENYGRSHCEDILGDLQSLDSYTKSLIDGMAAASTFWLCLDPSGITEIDDVSAQANGSWIPARKEDLFVMSPSDTMKPQLSAAQLAVETMRQELGRSFMMTGAAIPSGDRVTATAVRIIGTELETTLGGAFSAIARDLMEPIIKRIIFLMIENDELDKEIYDQFFSHEGTLIVEVITGLQALSRDSDLQKLIQMGEMVRNLPQEAHSTFKWSEYSKALITSLGFDYRNWVISEEEIQSVKQQQLAQQQQLMQQQQQQQMVNQVMLNAGNTAAVNDVNNNGGQGVKQVLGNMGVDTSILG